MKRVFYGFLFICVLTVMFAISKANCAEVKKESKMKDLVVYYSLTGNTELVAKTLADSIKADIIKIEDEQTISKTKAYTSGSIAAKQGKSWTIKPFNADFAGYDRIFVGSPVWFGMPTPEINACIEKSNFSGKQVVIFVTMGGSGADGAIKAMSQKITAKGGKIISSFSIKTGMAKKDVIITKTKEVARQY